MTAGGGHANFSWVWLFRISGPARNAGLPPPSEQPLFKPWSTSQIHTEPRSTQLNIEPTEGLFKSTIFQAPPPPRAPLSGSMLIGWEGIRHRRCLTNLLLPSLFLGPTPSSKGHVQQRTKPAFGPSRGKPNSTPSRNPGQSTTLFHPSKKWAPKRVKDLSTNHLV